MLTIGSQILEAAKAKNPNKNHPRIIMTAEDFARLRENKDKGITQKIVAAVLANADKHLEQPPRIYEIPDGVRLLSTSRAVEWRLMYLSYAYQITGEEKYAARAVKEIESLMTNVNDDFTGKGSYFNVVGGNLDRVYFVGLRFFCRELVREYGIERAMRRKLEQEKAYDFVIAGGIYDDNRVIRTMHGAYSQTKSDRVVRYAGNPVFPNGTITVRLNAPKDAKVTVDLDPDGAKACRVDKSWKDGVWTVTVGKKGVDYPGVLSIACRP
jgi:hypothetical protein